MDKALPPNNIQDNFLNAARRERSGVTIYLISGVKLTGRIKSFDKYSLILEAGSQEQLIFKHAISTVSLPRGMHRGPGRPPSLAACGRALPAAFSRCKPGAWTRPSAGSGAWWTF